jgi:MarR family 2-MHQ and catechol resistance regulon transcriptional repressor
MSEGPTASSDDLYDAFEALFAAQRRLRGRDARLLDGISLAQFRLLRTLARQGAMPIGQFAARVGITAAAATQLLDGLETRGLVQRTRCGDDRRVVNIDLTAEGQRRAKESLAHHRQQFEAALDGLSAAQVHAGVDVLRRCASYLDAL